MKTEFIEESKLYQFKPELLKSRVAFKREDGTIYLAVKIEDKVIAFAGYKLLPDSVRLKTDYVIPGERGKGIYDQLFKARLEIIRKKWGEVRMTSYCTEMSISTYKRYGFKATTKKNGITFMIYE